LSLLVLAAIVAGLAAWLMVTRDRAPVVIE